jgi:hypothetical protein
VRPSSTFFVRLELVSPELHAEQKRRLDQNPGTLVTLARNLRSAG